MDQPKEPHHTIYDSHMAAISHWLDTTHDAVGDWGEMYRSAMDANNKALAEWSKPKDPTGSTLGQYYRVLKHYLPTERYESLPESIRSGLQKMQVTAKTFNEWLEQDWLLDSTERWARSFDDHGILYGPPYNHQFLTEDNDGNIVAVDPEDIISLFQATPRNGWVKPTHFPHLIFTSSHASGENLSDVTGITHGIEAVARQSWGKPLNIARAGAPIQPGQTLVLYSCETEKNPLLNGVLLTRRVKELKARERDGLPDIGRYMSPGAKRIGALMMACMSENYYQDAGEGKTRPLFSILHPHSLRGSDARVQLSEDASRVAQHMSVMGFSKGGNVAKDSMRYLENELCAKGRDGRDVVRTAWEPGYERGITQLGNYGVRCILHNINLGVVYARERPLNGRQKAHGINCVAFNNRNDPLTMGYDFPGSTNDEFYLLDGPEENAHAPQIALGTRTTPGTVMDESRVARRMREWFAPHYGRAAIANILFEEGRVMLEAAPGTPDEKLADHGDTIAAALEKAGLHDVKLVGNHAHVGLFEIHTREQLFGDRLALKRLHGAFEGLRRAENGLVIAQSILDHDIPQQIDAVSKKTPGR
jgi:hypothetical protein